MNFSTGTFYFGCQWLTSLSIDLKPPPPKHTFPLIKYELLYSVLWLWWLTLRILFPYPSFFPLLWYVLLYPVFWLAVYDWHCGLLIHPPFFPFGAVCFAVLCILAASDWHIDPSPFSLRAVWIAVLYIGHWFRSTSILLGVIAAADDPLYLLSYSMLATSHSWFRCIAQSMSYWDYLKSFYVLEINPCS